ncbi:MAG: hypothetical protein K8R59_11420, partial [Thermoanaerobaculales bacterium]|nr:hypothetical protein [Thermoanaerobaculales bacterium]
SCSMASPAISPAEAATHRPRSWSRILRLQLFRAVAVVGGLVLAVLLVEGNLRLFPQLFSREVMDWAFSRYDTLPGGIYVKERSTRMRFMRADFSTHTYSHGYWWTHRTDSLGFRNPPEINDRRVLLLGDSLVYGHGVEEEDTVAHFLRSEHGVSAYNMASQGQCLYEHYVLLRLYLDRLQPETVVLFVFLNDFRDLEKKRTEGEIKKIPELRRNDYEEVLARVDVLKNERPRWLQRTALELGGVRLATKWYQQRARAQRQGQTSVTSPTGQTTAKAAARAEVRPATPRATPEPRTPGAMPKGKQARDLRRLRASPHRVETAVMIPERFRPIARYYNQVLLDMARRCEERGVRLVVIQLFLPKEDSRSPIQVRAQRKLHSMLLKIADHHDLELHDTEASYTDAEETCFLPHDGHLNSEGHRRLAAFLATEVLQSSGE